MGPATVEQPELTIMQTDQLQSVESIRKRLVKIIRQEKLIRLVLGISTVLLLFFPVLGLACAIDWRWDLEEDTPLVWRILSFIGLATYLGILVWNYLARQLSAPITESIGAGWVEKHFPQYNHSMTTVLQLNRPEARLEGQSPILLSQLTSEVMHLSKDLEFSNCLDKKRWTISARRLATPIIFALLCFGFHPATTKALLLRQLLIPRQIPRDTVIGLPDKVVLPEGETTVLTFEVRSRSGKIIPKGRVTWVSKQSEQTTLEATSSGNETMECNIPFSLGEGVLMFRAGDSRAGPIPLMRMLRPVLEMAQASVASPDWYGKRPDGSLYEETFAKGDVTGLAGSTVKLNFTCSQKLSSATISVKPYDPNGSSRQFPCKLVENGHGCEVDFKVLEGDHKYQVHATNTGGLESLRPFQRRIQVLPDEPPVVTLLPDQLPGTSRPGSTPEDTDIDGLPVLVGQKFRVVYQAKSMAGIASAKFRYRINEKGAWRSLPLQEFAKNDNLGDFLPDQGAFAKSTPESNIDFYPLPSEDLWKSPPRRQAGGRFDFQIGSIKELRIGDRIEYFVEASDLRPEDPLVGQSEIRVKEVVGVEELLAWWRRKEKETEKLMELKNRQGQVFDGFMPLKRNNP